MIGQVKYQTLHWGLGVKGKRWVQGKHSVKGIHDMLMKVRVFVQGKDKRCLVSAVVAWFLWAYMLLQTISLELSAFCASQVGNAHAGANCQSFWNPTFRSIEKIGITQLLNTLATGDLLRHAVTQATPDDRGEGDTAASCLLVSFGDDKL